MPVSILDMQKTLLGKLGFSPSESKHHLYSLYDSDGKQVVTTKLSHGSSGRDIDKGIISCIARQIHLTTPQLRDAVRCPLSRSDYYAILKERHNTFDVKLEKSSKNGLLRDAYLTSEKSNTHFIRVYRIISHQKYNINLNLT